jgi:hypothetical protein
MSHFTLKLLGQKITTVKQPFQPNDHETNFWSNDTFYQTIMKNAELKLFQKLMVRQKIVVGTIFLPQLFV